MRKLAPHTYPVNTTAAVRLAGVIDRPLRGETLCLDLLNSEWVDASGPRDLFDEPGGVPEWLGEHGYPQDACATGPLRAARAAVRAHLENAELDAINAVLARGTRSPRLEPGGQAEVVDVEAAWRPAWDAAVDLVGLVSQRRDRIRRCAHPACVLWFLDTSRNGTRRWCSMDTCGNRAKAGRHYARASGRTG